MEDLEDGGGGAFLTNKRTLKDGAGALGGGAFLTNKRTLKDGAGALALPAVVSDTSNKLVVHAQVCCDAFDLVQDPDLKKEAAWRLPANCDLETARGIVVSNMVFSETKGRPAR